jgi:hypothetical protein
VAREIEVLQWRWLLRCCAWVKLVIGSEVILVRL